MAGIGDVFGGGLGDIFDSFAKKAEANKNEAKPLPQIRAKRVNGVWFVRAEDVADALQASGSETNARLIAKLRGLVSRES